MRKALAIRQKLADANPRRHWIQQRAGARPLISIGALLSEMGKPEEAACGRYEKGAEPSCREAGWSANPEVAIFRRHLASTCTTTLVGCTLKLQKRYADALLATRSRGLRRLVKS